MRFTSNEEFIKAVERHFKIRLEESRLANFYVFRFPVWNEEDIEEVFQINLVCKDETVVSEKNLDWDLMLEYRFGNHAIALNNYNIKTSKELDVVLLKFEKAKGLLK